MAVTTQVATQHEDGTWHLSCLQGGDLKPVATPSRRKPRQTIMALPDCFFSRRQQPKIFSQTHKLLRVLPGLVQDVLLQNGDYQAVTQLHERTVTTFLIRDEDTQKLSTQLEDGFLPLAGIAPESFGLSYFAPEDAAAIIIIQLEGRICAALCSRKGLVIDGRTFDDDGWRKESLLTLRAWQELKPEANIYVAGNIMVPKSLSDDIKPLNYPEELTPTQLVGYGLIKLHEAGKLALIQKQPAHVQKQLNNFARHLQPLAALLAIITVLAGFNFSWQQHTISNQLTQLENANDEIFKQTLPNTPAVDPALQLSRRYNELSLLAGKNVSQGSSLIEDLNNLYKKVSARALPLTLAQLQLSTEQLKLRGSMNSLSEVDSLLTINKNIWQNMDIKLRSADLADNNKVTFNIEGSR